MRLPLRAPASRVARRGGACFNGGSCSQRHPLFYFMNQISDLLTRGGCLLFLVASSVVAPGAASDRSVILISLDGFPAWLWAESTLPVPTLRRMAAEGVSARAMEVSNPSITWINHTTMVTGVRPEKHGVLYNGLLVRQGEGQPPKIEQWADKARMVRVPTLYDLAFQAGLTTAQVDWVAITNAGTIHWAFHEIPNPDGEIELEMVGQGLVTRDEIAGFTRGKDITWRDMIWTRAAVHILKTRRPNLLLFHPLTTDATNHRYGPGTTASFAAYAYADSMVAELLRAIEAAGMKERTTVIIVTDHGFKKVQKVIQPNVALRKAGFVRTAGPTVTSCDAYVMTQGGMAMLYVTREDRREEVLSKCRTLLEGMEGVARVVEPKDYASLGMPTPAVNPGAGDLVCFAKNGYAFQSTVMGDAEVADSGTYLGTHGYPGTDPELDGIFIAWGSGIRQGVRLERVRNIDVAPTAAHLLGIDMKGVDGRVLNEILK